MPNGGIHRERVGICPHCRNPRIRTRRRQHRRMNWRCRNCNRIFAAPSSRYVVVEEWPGVDLVYLDRTQRRQTGGSRPAGQGSRSNFGCGCLFIVLIIVGVTSFFAVSRNADFPGAQILRSAGQEISQRLEGNGTGEGEEPSVPTPTPIPKPASTSGSIPTRSLTPPLTPVLGSAIKPTPTPQDASAPSIATIPKPLPTTTPTQTPGSIPTRSLTPPLTPVLGSAIEPTSTPQDASAPSIATVPKPLPTTTPTQTPAPLPPPYLRHHDAKLYMLELINSERTKAGVPPVTLGNNIAAQLHAESSLANCFSSHWGADGLKPYMRYSLAGGYQTNGENGSGSDYCIRASDRYRALGNIEAEIREMMEGWMNSPGHRRNILGKWHRKVNIGLAWDRYNMVGYQHFEDGFVQYDQLPRIMNGTLSMSGSTLHGLRFSRREELGLQIYYDPPPHSLTRGQVSRTYCYDSGLQIAALRYPLTDNSFWSENDFTKRYSPCPDPYDVSPEAPAPRSHDEAHRFWQQAYAASQAQRAQTVTVPWVTASKWMARATDFSITANVSKLLTKYGPGVYTVLLWGEVGGEDVPISEYSIFHEIEPPDTYNPDLWK